MAEHDQKQPRRKPKTPSAFANLDCHGKFTWMKWTRFFLILVGWAAVLQAWITSVDKYLTRTTSLSITAEETLSGLYPSITICPGYKPGKNMETGLINLNASRGGIRVMTDNDWTAIIDNVTFSMEDFLPLFSHPAPSESIMTDSNLARNVSGWKEIIPHLYLAGKCFTYDPDFESNAGLYHGMTLVVDYGEYNISSEQASDMLHIYLHDRDSFFFFIHDPAPNTVKLDNSKLNWDAYNDVAITYSRATSLEKDDNPCVTDPDYSYLKCVEKAFAERRGCQKPWLFFEEFDHIGNCSDVESIKELTALDEWDTPFWPTILRSYNTSCWFPCVASLYELDYSSRHMDVKNATTLQLTIAYKNFKFTYIKEFLACNFTCLIGEIGGSFGFYLGGSILLMFDVLASTFAKVKLARKSKGKQSSSATGVWH